jgi:hypothetical protein
MDVLVMRRIPLWLAAHEAGHAVARIWLGPCALEPAVFEYVCVGEPMSPTHKGRGYMRLCEHSWSYYKHELATVYMAGRAAEVRISKKAWETIGFLCSDDARLVRELGVPFGLAYDGARLFVRQHWPRILRLAYALQEHRKIYYRQAAKIVLAK